MGSVRGLVTALGDMEKQVRRGQDAQGHRRHCHAGREHADRSAPSSIENMPRITGVYSWAAPIVTALNASPMCNIDPACVKSRDDLNRVVTAYEDGSLGKLSDLGRQLKVTQDGQTLDQTLRGRRQEPRRRRSIRRASWVSPIRPASSRSSTACSRARPSSPTPVSSSPRASRPLVDKTSEMGGGLDQASGVPAGDEARCGRTRRCRGSTSRRRSSPRPSSRRPQRSSSPPTVTPPATWCRPRSIRSARRRWIRSRRSSRPPRAPGPTPRLADAKVSMVGFSVGAEGHSRLLQRRRRVDHHRHADRRVPHPGGAAALARGADLPGGIGDPLLRLGGGDRGALLPIHSGRTTFVERAGHGVPGSGGGRRGLQPAAHLADPRGGGRPRHPVGRHPHRGLDGWRDHLGGPHLCGVDVRA